MKTRQDEMTYKPDLDKMADKVLFEQQVGRAKAVLERLPLPQPLQAAQAAKAKAAQLCLSLKHYRQRQHLTQSQLAERVGMHKEFISRIENGHVDLQLSTFLKIVEGIGMKVEIS